MSQWITSFQAVEQLKKANFSDPMTLAIWAKEGDLRTCAEKMKCDGKIAEKMSDKPGILPEFWDYIYGDEKSHANWRAGVFKAKLFYDLDDWGEHPEHTWEMHGVMFSAEDLADLIKLQGASELSSQEADVSANRNARGAGRRPDKERWAHTAAAMAVLAAKGQFDPEVNSENVLHHRLDSFLEEHGYEEGLKIDSLRRVFELYREWSAEGIHGGD